MYARGSFLVGEWGSEMRIRGREMEVLQMKLGGELFTSEMRRCKKVVIIYVTDAVEI